MSEIGDQLRDNREPLLLLYLADELSPADRAEVKRLLAEDASLQQDLESLRVLHEQVVEGLQELDSATPLTASADRSTRRIIREMRRHQLESASRAPMHLETSSVRRLPGWMYPVAAAAAIIFIVLGMWGVGIIDFTPGLPGPRQADVPAYPNEYYMPYPDQIAQQRLEEMLFRSLGGDEIDHPLELEESEDPGAFISTEVSS